MPADCGIRLRVSKIELYEIRPPPGNNGGAVSGAAPCPLAVETETSAITNNGANCLQAQRSADLTLSPPVRNRHCPSTRWRKPGGRRSEEHTSELQSRFDLVCRLLLEKKKKKKKTKKHIKY